MLASFLLSWGSALLLAGLVEVKSVWNVWVKHLKISGQHQNNNSYQCLDVTSTVKFDSLKDRTRTNISNSN